MYTSDEMSNSNQSSANVENCVVDEERIDPVCDIESLLDKHGENLVPLKEDLADWLSKLLDIDITADNFMSILDTGVHVCKLAQLVQQKASEWRKKNRPDEVIPSRALRCRQAESGSWFARDNVANFLFWCREYKLSDDVLFETEGLVLHSQPRNVVVCLLEIARIGARYGLDPLPNLVTLEREIDSEVENGNDKWFPNNNDPVAPDVTSPTRVQPLLKESRVSESEKLSRPITPQSKFTVPKLPNSPLDDEVMKRVKKCQCTNCYNVRRLAEGKYVIGGKTVFIRLLNQRHVMVRVGGGWDTLDHYLEKHDPCRAYRVMNGRSHRVTSAGVGSLRRNNLDVETVRQPHSASPDFLVFTSRYKAS